MKGKSVELAENPLELATLLIGKTQNLIKTLPTPDQLKIFLAFRDVSVDLESESKPQ